MVLSSCSAQEQAPPDPVVPAEAVAISPVPQAEQLRDLIAPDCRRAFAQVSEPDAGKTKEALICESIAVPGSKSHLPDGRANHGSVSRSYTASGTC